MRYIPKATLSMAAVINIFHNIASCLSPPTIFRPEYMYAEASDVCHYSSHCSQLARPL